MSIQEANEAAQKYLASEPAAIEIEFEVTTKAGNVVYAIFSRNGLERVNKTPQSGE